MTFRTFTTVSGGFATPLATELIALMLFQRLTQRFLLRPHRNAPKLCEQVVETTLAERAAARATDLVDQAIGGEIEGVAVVEGESVVGESCRRRIAAVADAPAVAFDLDHAFLVRAPEREARSGEAHLALGRFDEANARFKPVVGLASLLVLTEQALHAAM